MLDTAPLDVQGSTCKGVVSKAGYVFMYGCVKYMFIVCVVFIYIFTGKGVQVPETPAVWNMSGRRASGIPYAHIWPHMCPHEPNMNPFVPKWVHMATIALIWAHMGPHGSMWAHGLVKKCLTRLTNAGGYKILVKKCLVWLKNVWHG